MAQQDDLIGTYVNRFEADADTAYMLKNLNDIYTAMKRINSLKISIEASSSFKSVTEASKSYRKEQDEMLRVQNDIDKAYKKRMAAETELGKILAEEKELLRQVTAEQKNFIREQNAQSGSLEQMRAQLIRLNKEYDNLSAADRSAAKGLDLKSQVKSLSDELKNLEGDTGRFQRNVGNYAGSLGPFFEKLKDQIVTLKTEQQGLIDLSKRNPIGFTIGDQERLNKVTAALTELEAVQQVGFRTTGNQAKQVQVLGTALQTLKASGNQSHEVLDALNNSLEQGSQKATKAGGIFTKLYSGIRQIANILPGLGLSGVVLLLLAPLQALGEALFNYVSKSTAAGRASADLERQYKQTTQAVHESMNEYVKASKEVNELKVNIDLAKQGFLSKKEVLNEYNNTLGQSLGKVKSLDEAEKNLVDKGDAYVKMTLYKAAANIALENAAKKAFEAEETRRKRDDEFANGVVDSRVSSTLIPGSGTFNASDYDAETKRIQLAQKARKDKLYKDQKNAENEQLDIARKFQQDAAKLASQFKIDFFGGHEDDKKEKKGKKDLFADLQAEFETYKAAKERLAQLFLESANDEKLSYSERILNLNQFIRIKQGLAADEGELALKQEKLTIAQRKAIGDKVSDDQIKIALDTDKVLEKIQEDHLKQLAKMQGGEVDLYSNTYKKLHEKLQEYLKKRGEAEAKANLKSSEEYRKAMSDAQKQLGEELGNLAFDLLGDSIEKQKNAIQEQLDAIDKKKEKEIAAANASIGSAQDKANAVALIEAKAASQHEQLQRRQKQLDEQKARFDKARSIAEIIENTTIAIVKTIAQFPGPQGVTLAAIIGAIGAAQLARVIAQPVPHYAQGTWDHPGGEAVVGDGGRSELVIEPSGRTYRTPSHATVMDLPAHSIVHPDAQLAFNTTKSASDRALAFYEATNTAHIDVLVEQNGLLRKGFRNLKDQLGDAQRAGARKQSIRDLWALQDSLKNLKGMG